MKRLTGVIVGILTVAFFAQAVVFAQDSQPSNREERITLSPAVTRPELTAGEQVRGKLTVINDGSVEYDFVLYARPFSVKGEQYDPNYTEVNERTEAYQWVQFDKTRFTLAPGDRIEAGYTVTVPPRAAPGGHYAVLFAETQPPADGSNIARKKRVGSLLYMTVEGDIERAGKVASWNAAMWQTADDLTSTLRIENSGNVHFQADVKANYTNLFGKKRFELNQELLVLPGTTRRVPINWENPPAFGIFKAGGTVSFLDKTETLPTKWVVYISKPVLIGVAVAVILITGLILLRRLRRRKAGTLSREQKQ